MNSIVQGFPLRIAILFSLFVVHFSLYAQNEGALKKANQLYENMAYLEAIKYYEKALKKGFDKNGLVRLADSYRRTHNSRKAAEVYSKVVNLNQIDPINYFYFAQALMNEGLYSEAAKWFDRYAKAVPTDPRGAKFAASCRTIESYFADSAEVRLRPFPHNTKVDEFSPVWYKEGILFSSSRADGDMVQSRYEWNGQPFLDLYYTKMTGQGEKFTRPYLIKGKLNTRFHEATSAWDSLNQIAYFTRNNFFEGRKVTDEAGVLNLKLFYADVPETGPWTNVRSMPFNSDAYSVGHPAVMAGSQTLIFISDLPGGYGGTDLYRSDFKEDGWTAPQNLGPDVNSPGNEMFPYLTADGTLYFASDGLGGLGGLDIFHCQLGAPDCKPQNLGAPINGQWDDFGFLISADLGWGMFSSNRLGGVGADDMYIFEYLKPVWNGVVVDAVTREPIPGAHVAFHLPAINRQLTGDTDPQGKLHLMLQREATYQVTVDADQYRSRHLEISTLGTKAGDILQDTLFMERPPVRVVTTVLDMYTGFPIRNADVRVVGTDMTLKTDSAGQVSFYFDPYPEYETKPVDCPPQPQGDYCFRFKDEAELPFDTLQLTYEWSFGDGVTLREKEPRHCYSGPGTYHVELNLLDPAGKVFMNQATYELEVRPPAGLIIQGPDTVTVGEKVSFSAASTTLEGCDLTSYSWALNTGEIYEGLGISHVFTRTGQYTLRLNVSGTGEQVPEACGGCITRQVVVMESGWQQSRKDSLATTPVYTIPAGTVLLDIVKPGYERHRLSFDPGLEKGVAHDSVYLNKIETGASAVIEVSDATSKLRLKDARLILRDPATGMDIGTYAMENGTLTLPLEPGRPYQLLATKEGYLTELGTIEPIPLGKKPRIIRIELKQAVVGTSWILHNLYYDFDKYHIRHDAAIELEKLTGFLKANPGLTVELGSHTDVRGTDEYNVVLAQNRANSAVEFLKARGISGTRIIARGYGEQRLTNRCDNGINCSEELHQENRRTEITVLGFKDPIYSQARRVEEIWGMESLTIPSTPAFDGPFTILVGTYLRQKPSNHFQALAPRFNIKSKSVDGFWEYTTGSYPSYASAAADLPAVRAQGFPHASILARPAYTLPTVADNSPAKPTKPTGNTAPAIAPEDVYYAVQVAVLGRTVPPRFLESFGEYRDRLYEKQIGGNRVFFVGKYKTEQEALKHLAKIRRTGHSDAFLVHFDKGKKTNLDKIGSH